MDQGFDANGHLLFFAVGTRKTIRGGAFCRRKARPPLGPPRNKRHANTFRYFMGKSSISAWCSISNRMTRSLTRFAAVWDQDSLQSSRFRQRCRFTKQQKGNLTEH